MNSSRNLEDICYNCSISINRKEDGGGKKRPKDGTELCCILLRAIDGLLKGSSPHFLSVWWGLLSHFSRVRLCATPETAGHQAPPSLGFSRQEHWSGWPFPSPMHKSEVKGKLLSRVRPSATPWTAAFQAPPSMGFSRQECWSGVPLPSPWWGLNQPGLTW